jgi:hypothetical protein
MKNRKASGPGGITAEVVKNGRSELKQMAALFNKCIHKEIVPEERNAGFVIYTQKGD